MSHLSVLKTLTVSTGFGSIIAQVDPLKTGSELGSMAPSAILGVVCVTCVVGICVLYRGKERDIDAARSAHDEHTEKLYKLIEENTKANQAHADNAHTVSEVLVEVKEAVRNCRK